MYIKCVWVLLFGSKIIVVRRKDDGELDETIVSIKFAAINRKFYRTAINKLPKSANKLRTFILANTNKRNSSIGQSTKHIKCSS